AAALGAPTDTASAAQRPLGEPGPSPSPLDASPGGPSNAAPGRVPSSPLARRIAAEAGVDLAELAAANPGRRIRRADVEAAASARKNAPDAQERVTVEATIPTDTARPLTSAASPDSSPPIAASDGRLPRGYEAVPHELIPHTPTRRAIAEHMVRSVSTAPQLTAQVDVDMSQVARVRAEVNALRTSQGKPKLSYLVFITRALVATIAEHPAVNATFTDTHLVKWKPVNVGIAVDTPTGLVVPVVHNAERLNLAGLAESIGDITARAANRGLTAEDLTGGTITISNAGSVGDVVIATPILNQPQVAALGVPAIIRQPVAVTSPDGEEYVAIRPVARMGLTFDHRALDGADAVRVLLDLRDKLQNWTADAYQ
ncbi:MAG: 2-oxo acid dehydrogenase subunit E2, partial [Streptomycetaceae bacterium]|nr:2-oxo acid dehydrogenase subunit E2 [Streptomycetaceae bacterium]